MKEHKVESGKLKLESGKLKLESGKLKVGSGKLKVGSGELRITEKQFLPEKLEDIAFCKEISNGLHNSNS